MPERDLALLTEAAHRAGAIARGWWKAGPKVWDKPGLGPVTEADLAVNASLEEDLRSARPGYGWLSEESPDDGTRLDAEHVFIIDPIDGTRSFIAGEPHFALSLAVARRGQITAAVVHLPALEQTFAAALGGPARRNGQPIRTTPGPALAEARILTTKPSLAPEHWRDGPPGFQRHFRSSVAYRLALVAAGEFDAMLSFRPAWEWDIAAGDLICRCAGAVVSDGRGRPISYNSETARAPGILAAGPALHAALVGRLAP